MLCDVRTKETVSEIPGASMDGVASEHDSGGDLEDAFSGQEFAMPVAPEGSAPSESTPILVFQ